MENDNNYKLGWKREKNRWNCYYFSRKSDFSEYSLSPDTLVSSLSTFVIRSHAKLFFISHLILTVLLKLKISKITYSKFLFHEFEIIFGILSTHSLDVPAAPLNELITEISQFQVSSKTVFFIVTSIPLLHRTSFEIMPFLFFSPLSQCSACCSHSSGSSLSPNRNSTPVLNGSNNSATWISSRKPRFGWFACIRRNGKRIETRRREGSFCKLLPVRFW